MVRDGFPKQLAARAGRPYSIFNILSILIYRQVAGLLLEGLDGKTWDG